ncbi:MAG: universal stress protein [Planctomycetota bacterium]
MKVLLATDGSKSAFAAARFFESLPVESPVELVLLTAIGDPLSGSPESTQHWYPEVVRQERQHAEEHHRQIIDLMQTRCNRVESVLRPGHPVRVILDMAKQIDCDLILMGAHGHSTIGRLLLGSVSDRVATHATCSVLVVRLDGKDEFQRKDPFRITAGYDNSKPSREALDELLKLQWDKATHLDLVSVAPAFDYLMGNGLSPAAIANEEAMFRQMKSGGAEKRTALTGTLPKTKTEVLQKQHAGAALVEAADQSQASMIVVGDVGHSLLDDILLGSTTKYVLRHAACSVWISRYHRRPNLGTPRGSREAGVAVIDNGETVREGIPTKP